MYETATALYALHAVAVGIYLFCPDAIVPLNGFEVAFPLGLLLFLAIGYGRVSSTLQAGDSDPALKILSPAKHPAPLHVPTSVADTATSSTTVGLGSEIAESENSDSTDSEEESGNSSSSSEDEAPTTEAMFEATANAQPSTTPNGVRFVYWLLGVLSTVILTMVVIVLIDAVHDDSEATHDADEPAVAAHDVRARCRRPPGDCVRVGRRVPDQEGHVDRRAQEHDPRESKQAADATAMECWYSR